MPDRSGAMLLEALRRQPPLIEVNNVNDYVMNPKVGIGMLRRTKIP